MTYCWYFTREDIDSKTPSREDGIPAAVETRYRRDGAKFLINASNSFGLRYETTATGVVFFHRFFMIQSLKQFDRYVVAAACLLLAGKVEETPKKCKDIIKTTRSLLNDQQIIAFGNNPKEELLTHERILLQTIKFDLQVEHPYNYLLKFGKELKGDKAKIEKLVQMAWTFVNDSLCTTLCLQWEPQALAVAFIYLAGKLTKYDLQAAAQSRSRSWWRNFVDTLDIHDLESICHQVLDIYGEGEEPQKKLEGPPPSQQEQPPQQPPPLHQPTLQQPQSQYAVAGTPQVQPQPHMVAKPISHSQFQPKQPSILPQPSAVAPPQAPPTQGAAATVAGMPAFQTHSSFLTAPGSLPSFGLANPLQALQNILPARQQAATTHLPIGSSQPLAYSTLNVSIANTRLTTLQQQIYSSSVLGSHPSTPVAGNPTLTASGLGMLGGYQQPTFPLPVAGAGYQLGTTMAQGGIVQGILPSPAKRPALDSAYRLQMQPGQLPTTRTLTPTQPQGSHPVLPATNIALLGRLPNMMMTQGQYLSTHTPTLTPAFSSQLQAQSAMGTAPPGSIRALSPQVSQPRPQQHQQAYNPAAGGNSWMRSL